MTYGARIKQARENRLLTQEQLAEQLDVSRQAVSKWEAGLSRPTRDKLDRLSEILDIPPETWEELDAEADKGEEPQKSDPAIFWKISTAVLAVLCAVLAFINITSSSSQISDIYVDGPQAVEEQEIPEGSSEEVPALPDAFPLFCRHEYNFAGYQLGQYNPAEVPFLDDWEQVMDNELWCGWFPDGTRLSLVPVSVQSGGREHSNVYLLYAPPVEAADGALAYHILYRIGEDYAGSGNGDPEVWPFTNVLGYDGFKITISLADTLYRDSTYIIQGPDGTPQMMAISGETGCEADVDDDGVLEIVSYNQYVPGWEIIDTIDGEEGAFIYTLNEADLSIPDGYAFAFHPDRGGFLITDGANSVISRCILRNGRLVRVPPTDFSALDYQDAADTEITFVTDYEQSQSVSDGLDPDVILPYIPSVRITHRQQAYIALQELYHLTGLKVDACYCTANQYGVYFSLLPDGFNQRCFFSASFGEDCGGSSVPSFYISWKELGNDWSPLSFSEALRPEGEDVNGKIASYYNRLRAFHMGEIESSSCLEPEAEGELYGYIGEGEFYVADGSLYVVNYLMRDGDPVLTALCGPYPGGITNH